MNAKDFSHDTWPKGPREGAQHPGQILSVTFQSDFPSTPNSNRPETSGIGKLMFLSFQAYVDRRKRSPYASWVSVLVSKGPAGRGRLELDLDWASNLTWTSSLFLSDSLLVSKPFLILSKVPKYNIIKNIIR